MTEAAEAESKKRKRAGKPKQAFIYGNYKNYYGYRIDRNQNEDPRLAVLRKEWFQDKDCLDVGCNQGLLTVSIANKFLCRSILGIDIDAGLIESAHWNLRKFVRMMKADKAKVSDCSARNAPQGSNEKTQTSPHGSSSPKEDDLFGRVSFKKENFVESLHGCSEKYDTIICLSVSKWIHLNWGDDGLITLFVKIWRLLRPGGIFVFEPQPWSSYENNRKVSKTATVNFKNILLRPPLFQEILLDKIGFRSAEIVTNTLSGTTTTTGFNRPILTLTK